MDYVSTIAMIGFIAGIPMAVWVIGMNKLGFTPMDVVAYLGCIVYDRTSGIVNFVLGAAVHFLLSIGVAFIYAFGFQLIGMAGLIPGLVFGVIHWAIALAVVLPYVFDPINKCVQARMMTPMKSFAQGYGSNAKYVFLVSHLLYGATVGVLYVYHFGIAHPVQQIAFRSL